MIRYDLRCAAGHGFDGWFRSSDDFDAQAQAGLLACPVCGGHTIEKALMAPAVATKRSGVAPAPVEQAATAAEPQPVALVDDAQSKLRAMLRELKEHVTKTSEDVGERFPEIARKMHVEEIERRSIRGRATAEEAKALVDEGVELHPLPVFPDDLN